jgi:hypothetical protein
MTNACNSVVGQSFWEIPLISLNVDGYIRMNIKDMEPKNWGSIPDRGTTFSSA